MPARSRASCLWLIFDFTPGDATPLTDPAREMCGNACVRTTEATRWDVDSCVHTLARMHTCVFEPWTLARTRS